MNKLKYITKKNIIAFVFVIITVLVIVNLNVFAMINTNLPVSYISDEFPASYQPYIDYLKTVYPNSTFKAVHTNVDWNMAVQHESYEVNLGISLVPSSYPDEWKYRPEGKDIYMDGTFVVASKQAVAYMLDPRNFLNATHVFQFETLSFSNETSSVASVNKMLEGTAMSSTGSYGNKYKNNNVWMDMEKTYAEYIYEAGQTHNISPTHIASRIIQETGADIVNNRSVNGSYPGYTGLYNFFNIGATPDSDGNNSVRNGLIYASSKGWTTPGKSIIDGSAKLADNYIKWGQDTIYFQKFDVNNPGHTSSLFGYQYMTNILAPRSESQLMYEGYKKADMLNLGFEFHIPVYLNMPEYASPYPGTSVEDPAGYEEDNTKVFLDDNVVNGTDKFNIRSSPDTSSSANIIDIAIETKEGGDNRRIFTRIGKGNSGWDKILLENGQVAYVYSLYVQEYNYVKVTDVTFNSNDIKIEEGSTFKLEATVNPSDARFKDLEFKSLNEDIVTISNDGNITAKQIGQTEIQVKSLDEGKIFTVSAEVVSKVKEIKFDKTEYSVYENTSMNIIPSITSSFTEEYELNIADTTVAIIEGGKVKGIKEGTTTLTATIKGTDIKATTTINILKQDESNPVIFDGSLNVDLNTKIITKVEPNTKVSTVVDKITTSSEIKVYNANNELLSNDDFITTGTVIHITNGSTVDIKYTVIIYGDVNFDSSITASDYVLVKNHIMGISVLNATAMISGDSNKDLNISASDYVLIKNHIMKDDSKIEQ